MHAPLIHPSPSLQRILSPKSGFLGMVGERGIGGSKCGATAVNVVLYAGAGGATRVLAANIGDARTLLIRGGEAIDLSEEHVPDKWVPLAGAGGARRAAAKAWRPEAPASCPPPACLPAC